MILHRPSHSKQHPDCQSQKGQASYTCIPSMSTLKHDGKSREKHVQSSVDLEVDEHKIQAKQAGVNRRTYNGHVYTNRKYDRLLEQ